MSFENFMRGVQAAEAELEGKRKRTNEAEDRKIAKARLHLEDLEAKRKEAIESMNLNPFPIAPEIATAAPQTTTMPFPGQVGESQISTFPDRSTPLPLPPTTIPGVQGPDVQVPRTSMQQHLQLLEEQRIKALQGEVEKAQALEQAKAPFTFHPLAPGAQGVIGAGTPRQKIIQGPPKEQTPTISETTITVNGKGPVKAILVKNDDGTFKYINPNTLRPIEGEIGEYEKPPASQTRGGLSEASEANIVNRLVKDWDKATAPTRDLGRQVALMDVGLNAARRGDLAAGSQAVLVTFQKILDPTSVVRESEYMRSAAGQSLLNRIEGAAERLLKGGAGIPLDELEKFANLAHEAVAGMGGHEKNVRSRIVASLDRYKIPHDVVFGIQEASDGKQLSEALIQANMKANPGMTREQVIQELSK